MERTICRRVRWWRDRRHWCWFCHRERCKRLLAYSIQSSIDSVKIQGVLVWARSFVQRTGFLCRYSSMMEATAPLCPSLNTMQPSTTRTELLHIQQQSTVQGPLQMEHADKLQTIPMLRGGARPHNRVPQQPQYFANAQFMKSR